MKDELVTFETAKLAKEKGFDQECYEHYAIMADSSIVLQDNEAGYQECPDISQFLHTFVRDNEYLAPTQSLLQRWLREQPTPIIVTATTDFIAWEVEIQNPDKDYILITKNKEGAWFSSYEEALEIGLQEGLKLINKEAQQ